MSTTLDRPSTETGAIEAPRLPVTQEEIDCGSFDNLVFQGSATVTEEVTYSTLEDYVVRGVLTQEQIDQARSRAVVQEQPAPDWTAPYEPPTTPPITAEMIDASTRAAMRESTSRAHAEAYARNLMDRYGVPQAVVESVINASRMADQGNEDLVLTARRFARHCDCTGPRSSFLWR